MAIKKRSQFIVYKQQHTNSIKWYNGLYSVWDMDAKELRDLDNTDGFDNWWGYVLASDDPALCKAPFLAAKNVFIPNDKETSMKPDSNLWYDVKLRKWYSHPKATMKDSKLFMERQHS